jgi:hypothetical protein
MSTSGANRSNHRAALDAATALCLPLGRQRRGASERGYSKYDTLRNPD